MVRWYVQIYGSVFVVVVVVVVDMLTHELLLAPPPLEVVVESDLEMESSLAVRHSDLTAVLCSACTRETSSSATVGD